MENKNINSAELIMPCPCIDETLEFFVDDLGFLLETIYPADAPRVAVVSGFGVRLRLDAEAAGDPGSIRLYCGDMTAGPYTRTAPNGALIEFVANNQPLELPPLKPTLVVQCGHEHKKFGQGRAGMQYRDLIPDRFGGRFIASHIRIPDGGPVPDYVHHHHVQFQLIFCANGWVRVVYEDQGPPMLMEAGDCFLQPPHIRHRVLECSDQFEVVEIGCPAEHETLIDHDMTLPTKTLEPERSFNGQRFVFHRASSAAWLPSDVEGIEQQQTAIEAATNGIVSVNVMRATRVAAEFSLMHDDELRFLFVLQGNALFDAEGEQQSHLHRGDSCAIPPAMNCRLSEISADFKVLEVCVPSQ